MKSETQEQNIEEILDSGKAIQIKLISPEKMKNLCRGEKKAVSKINWQSGIRR